MHAEDETAIAEQLRTQDASGRVVIEIGLLVTLYFVRTWAPDIRASVATCTEAFLAQCGDRIRWAKNPKTLRMVRFEHEWWDVDDDPTTAQLASVENLIKTLKAELGTITKLGGHRDYKPSTECPGNAMYPRLGDLRKKTALGGP